MKLTLAAGVLCALATPALASSLSSREPSCRDWANAWFEASAVSVVKIGESTWDTHGHDDDLVIFSISGVVEERVKDGRPEGSPVSFEIVESQDMVGLMGISEYKPAEGELAAVYFPKDEELGMPWAESIETFRRMAARCARWVF